jgi:hypothetical protein
MAKMMMGQIDHARDRIKQLKAEKLGAAPKVPAFMDTDELHTALRDGSVVPFPAQMKKALHNFTTKKPSRRIKRKNERWDYNRQQHVSDGVTVVEVIPDSISAALCDLINEKEIDEAIQIYSEEQKEYLRRSKILDDESTKVEDAIVLGDQHAALIALQEFAAFTV